MKGKLKTFLIISSCAVAALITWLLVATPLVISHVNQSTPVVRLPDNITMKKRITDIWTINASIVADPSQHVSLHMSINRKPIPDVKDFSFLILGGYSACYRVPVEVDSLTEVYFATDFSPLGVEHGLYELYLQGSTGKEEDCVFPIGYCLYVDLTGAQLIPWNLSDTSEGVTTPDAQVVDAPTLSDSIDRYAYIQIFETREGLGLLGSFGDLGYSENAKDQRLFFEIIDPAGDSIYYESTSAHKINLLPGSWNYHNGAAKVRLVGQCTDYGISYTTISRVFSIDWQDGQVVLVSDE